MLSEFFRPGNATRSPAAQKIHAWYEILYTTADVTAGLLFTTGSVLFLLEVSPTLARVLFLCGSLLFLSKPLIRLGRELALYRQGETGELASKALDHEMAKGLRDDDRKRAGAGR